MAYEFGRASRRGGDKKGVAVLRWRTVAALGLERNQFRADAYQDDTNSTNKLLVSLSSDFKFGNWN